MIYLIFNAVITGAMLANEWYFFAGLVAICFWINEITEAGSDEKAQ